MDRTFKVNIILIGNSVTSIIVDLKAHLQKVFKSICEHSLGSEDVLSQAFNATRGQYNSSVILGKISKSYRNFAVDRILAVVDVDLYVPNLNFVFGEAECPGFAALISTFRLKPEFYGYGDDTLYVSRVEKEAVHELGHTVGLKHCSNPRCVMRFSNSILDTDRKNDRFCSVCDSLLFELLQKMAYEKV